MLTKYFEYSLLECEESHAGNKGWELAALFCNLFITSRYSEPDQDQASSDSPENDNTNILIEEDLN